MVILDGEMMTDVVVEMAGAMIWEEGIAKYRIHQGRDRDPCAMSSKSSRRDHSWDSLSARVVCLVDGVVLSPFSCHRLN